MLSEARSAEVKYLLEGWSTGIRGMTTLHTDDVRNVPDRILSMLPSRTDADRMENDIYQALDVGLLIRKKKDEAGKLYRYIDQVCFFLRENGQNQIMMVVNEGKFVLQELPKQLRQSFARAGIAKPFECFKLDRALKEDGRELEAEVGE
jgi:pilus assembly protein CpaF